MICNPMENENDNEIVDFIPPKEEKLTDLFEYANMSRIIIHICIHISLLSLLEPFFYFLYVVKIERKLFFDQIKIFIEKFIDYLNANQVNELLNNPAVYYSIVSILGDDRYLDEKFVELKYDCDQSLDRNDDQKIKLEKISFTFSGISFGVTILYFIIHQCIFKEKYLFFKIMLEHILLIGFIGLYEYWFFNHIVLNYSPWTEEEITYYAATCTMTKARQKISSINMFFKNETTCDLE